MTGIIDNLNAPNMAAPSAQANPASALDQNAFLRLMTTQLTTQDPFNPVDNTQMVAQMAQFSQVAGIAEMNRSLQAIVQSLGAGRLSDAVYAATPAEVEHVCVDGEFVVRNGRHTRWDEHEVVRGVNLSMEKILRRAGITREHWPVTRWPLG